MNAPATLPAPAAQRHDGWLPERQHRFLAAIAEGFTVGEACRLVGLSTASAYAFRRRPAGRVFALGWAAARLLARDHLADTLMARAIDGQVETYTRADGTEATRHRHDNRLALALLTRLDRLAEGEGRDAAEAAECAGGLAAARLVAQDFEGFLDLVAGDGGDASAGLFLAARAAEAEEAERIRQLRQLRRAEAHADPAPAGEADDADGEDGEEDAEDAPPVWYDEDERGWFTCFPPPDGWAGLELGVHGEEDYARALTPREEAVARARHDAALAAQRAADARERDLWFGFAPGGPDMESAGPAR